MQHDRNQRELAATFNAAMEFGLSDEQVWEAAREVATRTPAETPVSECREELIEVLAQRSSTYQGGSLMPAGIEVREGKRGKVYRPTYGASATTTHPQVLPDDRGGEVVEIGCASGASSRANASAGRQQTLREAADEWIKKAKAGEI